MKRSFVPVLIFVLFVCVFAFSRNVAAQERPNFVIVLVDDLGWADLGCYGSTFHETPRLDRMAQEGVRFTSAYAACAVCSPSRAALQTGLNPARIGITDWIRSKFQGGHIPPDGRNPSGYVTDPKRRLLCPENKLFLEPEYLTIAEHLKANGYTTCHLGKWHLGQESHTPQQQGYDINIGGCDLGQPPSYFDPYESGRADYLIPKESLPPRRPGEYLTDREADEAVKFIRTHKEKPFFLHLAHYAVHVPLQAKPEILEKYKAKLERMRNNGVAPKQTNATYAAMLQSVDEGVGRLLNTLEEEGIADRTYVIFTSDNGGLLGPTNNFPLRSEKGFAYEGGLRVPLIVRGPNLHENGTICMVPTITMDLFPTLCDWAEIPLPDSPLDGVSIRPLLEPKESERAEAFLERPLFWHFPHYRNADPGNSPYSIIRSGPWKLIRFDDGERLELYDLVNDLSETKNLASEEPLVVASLLKQLDENLDRLGAKRVKVKAENNGGK